MKNNFYVIIAGLGVGFSIIFLISTVLYMAIAKDLAKEVTNQRYYIRELEWELQQVDQMICSEVVE